jgi:hypothetical protein
MGDQAIENAAGHRLRIGATIRDGNLRHQTQSCRDLDTPIPSRQRRTIKAAPIYLAAPMNAKAIRHLRRQSCAAGFGLFAIIGQGVLVLAVWFQS